MTALRLEFFKTKRRGIWLILGAMLAVELAFLLFSYRNASEKTLHWGWMDLIYTTPVLHQIVFPVLICVLASRLADVEHKSGSMRLLGTIQSRGSLFLAKYVCGACYLSVLAVLELGVMLGIGYAHGFHGAPEVRAYALTLVFFLLTGMEQLALQLALSMNIPNQFVSLCIGCGGSFIGLLLLYLPIIPPLHYALPWGHLVSLMFVYQNWNKADGFISFYYIPIRWFVFVIVLVELIAILLLGRWRFCRREV